MQNVYTFDGRELKSMGGDKGLNDAYYSSVLEAGTMGGLNIVGRLAPAAAYTSVPWLYRAVRIKANAIRRFPFDLMRGETVVTDAPEVQSLMQGFRRLLFETVVSLDVMRAAYWYVDTNEKGKNIQLRLLRPNFVQPKVEAQVGVTGFVYSDAYSSVPREIPLDRIVYFWPFNLTSEAQPGPSDATVALSGASILNGLDIFTAGYFNSGGVKITVFEIPGNVTPADKDDFQNFLNRTLSGVRNAFRNIAVRMGVKPTVIGSDLKDTEAPEIMRMARENVATAEGIPPALIESKNENKATAEVNHLMLYTSTIIPLWEELSENANEQLFNRLGLELVGHPERLEVMQSQQLDQAQAISLIVKDAPLTVDEGRELLGREPMGGETEAEVEPEPKPEDEELETDDLETEKSLDPVRELHRWNNLMERKAAR